MKNIRRVFAWLAAYLKEMMKADAAEFHTVMPIREDVVFYSEKTV